jgi:hypothetical protein
LRNPATSSGKFATDAGAILIVTILAAQQSKRPSEALLIHTAAMRDDRQNKIEIRRTQQANTGRPK